MYSVQTYWGSPLEPPAAEARKSKSNEASNGKLSVVLFVLSTDALRDSDVDGVVVKLSSVAESTETRRISPSVSAKRNTENTPDEAKVSRMKERSAVLLPSLP